MEAEVERRPREAEDVEPAPEVGEAAVGDPLAAVRAEARVDEVELGARARRAIGTPSAPSRSQIGGQPAGGTARWGSPSRGARRPRRRASASTSVDRHPPRRGELAHVATEQLRGRARLRARRPRGRCPRPAFGLPSRSPPIHVPKRSGEPGSRSCHAATSAGAASQRLSSRNQSPCRISSTTRGRSERTSSVCQRIVTSSASTPLAGRALTGRQPRVVQLVEELRDPAVLVEDRARQRLRRVGGQHELDRHAVGRRRDLLLADALPGQRARAPRRATRAACRPPRSIARRRRTRWCCSRCSRGGSRS